MAEVARDRYVPFGYDEEFVNPVDEDFICTICQLPLKEPVLTRCGHRFCKECLEEYIRRQEQKDELSDCPVDRGVLVKEKDVFPDNATERKILSLAIKCRSEGCGFTYELRAKESHLALCTFKLIPCTNENCKVTMARKDLEDHLTAGCQWRTVECIYCQEPHPQCHMEDHYNKCKRFPKKCCGCLKLLSREMEDDHSKNFCPKTVISCPYAQMGCKTKVPREKLESHIQSDTGPHIKLVCLELTKTQEELTKRTREHEQRVKTLQEEVNLLRRQLEEKTNILEQEHAEHEEKTNTFQNNHEQRVKTLQEEVRFLKGNFEEKVGVLRREQAAHEVKFDAFQNVQEGRVKILQEDVNHLQRQIEDKADQEKMNIFQNDQEEKVKVLEEKVNVLRREQAAHEVKFDAFQNEQKGRVNRFQEDVNQFRRQLPEKADQVVMNAFHNDQEERVKNLEERLERANKRRKWEYVCAFCAFVAMLALKFR